MSKWQKFNSNSDVVVDSAAINQVSASAAEKLLELSNCADMLVRALASQQQRAVKASSSITKTLTDAVPAFESLDPQSPNLSSQ